MEFEDTMNLYGVVVLLDCCEMFLGDCVIGGRS